MITYKLQKNNIGVYVDNFFSGTIVKGTKPNETWDPYFYFRPKEFIGHNYKPAQTDIYPTIRAVKQSLNK